MSEATATTDLVVGLLGARPFSDERLVRRAVEGDERAFAGIYSRYHRDLHRYLLAILGNREDAADALQATMVKALRALPGERREVVLKPWLYRIAHNEAIDLVRRRRAAADPLEPEVASREPQPHEEVEQRARLRRLLADLDELPGRQRSTMVMRELSGLGFEEIATALGTSSGVVRQTLYEARLSLRQMETGRELGCDSVTKALSDADGRVGRRRDLRAHLRECSDCRHFQQAMKARRSDLRALAPLPAAVAAAVFKGALGGAAPGGTGAAAGGLGGALGASVAIKSVATIATVAVLGAAADHEGLVDLPLPRIGAAAVETESSGPTSPVSAPVGTRSGEGTAGAPGPSPIPATEELSRAPQGAQPTLSEPTPHGPKAADAALGAVGAHGKPSTPSTPATTGKPAAAADGQAMADEKKGSAGETPGQPAGAGPPATPEAPPQGSAGQPPQPPSAAPTGGGQPAAGPPPQVQSTAPQQSGGPTPHPERGPPAPGSHGGDPRK